MIEDKRLSNEIDHGKKLFSLGAENIWNWSSPGGKLRAERRTNYFVTEAKISSSDNVLEIGCGTGLFSGKVYNKTNCKLTSIDISPELINEAKNKYPEITFRLEDAMNTSFQSNTFDVVFGSSVLHHLDFKKSLQEIFRVLKPEGRIVFAEPNMLNPQILIQKNIPFIKKMLGDSPDETAVVRWKLNALLKEIGFTQTRAFPYDFMHPLLPAFSLPAFSKIGPFIEKIPLLKEIAGSVIIYAEKPK
ncbi:MAG TPA: class I SAM-dependent methyltransferase [Bacteroidia bacterium]|nr:class I SAM-dependent methyltransferase [Bacteroidia bacterium]HNU32918.1 class I SAM-dependent methyltransferase [Bacteroidia bacterium]